MEQTISERVIHTIARNQKIACDRITLESSLEELGIDSFDGVNLIFALEDEFDICIPDEKQEFKYVKDIVERLIIFTKIKS